MSFPQAFKSLLEAPAYPHPVGAVRLIETHISWILLTGEFAYKIKRPVALPFVDLRSAQRREFLCREEVRLNRRFAAELYLGVCNITAGGTGAQIDGSGAVIDHAVKMRQFEAAEELDSLLVSHRIEPAELEVFGEDLARVHAGLPVSDSHAPWGRPESVRATVLENLDECIAAAADFASPQELSELRGPLEQQLQAADPWMARRRSSGKVRECHGDLHCSNIVRRHSGLVAFDCLEFEPAFRWIDVADEVAFLLADMNALRSPAHMQAFLGGYLAGSGDYGACEFMNLYAAHRSLVRAKVTALNAAAAQEATREIFDSHVRCAQAELAQTQPLLILMSGLSGSGKTWFAKHVASAFAAIHIRSDVERKRLAGLAAAARSDSAPGQGLYAPEVSSQLYQHLLTAAESTLRGGFTTIVDATFMRRDDRRAFAEMARRRGASLCMVHCHAPIDVLRSRIEERARTGGDPSEANLAVLEWQQKHYEPLQANEPFHVLDVLSSEPEALVRLKRELQQAQSIRAA